METIFQDLVPFLLDLDTFHGPYYNSFGDGCPSFGPAHPPALPQTTPPLDRFSKLRLDRNSSDSRGARAALPCNMAGSISVHCVVQCLLPFSALFSTPTFHTSSSLSQLRRAQLGLYLGESASLGDIHLVSISKLPPFAPLIKTYYISCIH